MRKTPIALVVGALFAASAAPAMAQLRVTGSASVTGMYTDVTSRNPWRFYEYRDLDKGVFGDASIHGTTDNFDLHLFLDGIGRENRTLELSGRKYDDFMFTLYNNRIMHNLTFGAITPWTGVGTNMLNFPYATAAVAAANTGTWQRFDYRVEHENTGGVFEISRGSPFYFRTTANQKKSEGLRPLGAAATSPGGPAYEMPLPIDFTTTDVSAEVGYATRAQQYSLNVSYSKFADHNDWLFWRNPLITAPASTSVFERNTIASDNDMWKVALNAMWKQLPMGSALALRGTYSKLTNSIPIPLTYTSVVGATGNARLSNPSSPTFEGDVRYTTFTASLTSQPTRDLDTRIYYNYNDKDNESTRVTFAPGGPGAGGFCDINLVTGTTFPTCTNELFHYTRHNVGAEARYRLNRANRLGAGLEYTNTERARHDFHESDDWRGFVELRNTSLETASFRLRYQHLDRDSKFGRGDVPTTNPNWPFERFLYRFDVAPVEQNLLKAVVDYSPAPLVDLGLELIGKRNRYKKTFLGRHRDDREEVYVSAAFGDPARFRVTTFFDIEWTRNEGLHWQGATATFPNTNPAGTAFLWEDKVKERSWVVGLAGDWPFREWLRFHGSAIWQDTKGTVDFTTPNNVGNPQDIGAFDSFRRLALHLRATTPIQKNVELTVGGAYERFRYADAQMDGYNYTQVTGANQNLLSGAYAFPSYNARIVYVNVRYFIR
jgi:hypothetical protein